MLASLSACSSGGTREIGAVPSESKPIVTPVEKPAPKPAVAPFALAVMIDRSGSMSGDRMSGAKQALLDANDAMRDDDRYEVIAFDSIAKRTVAMRWGSERDETALEIGRIDAGGGTNVEPALKLAADDLADVKSTKKLAILITDGMFPKGSIESIARAMADSGVTVTTVALGADADAKLLESLAKIGGGRFYAVHDPKTLGKVVRKEIDLVRK